MQFLPPSLRREQSGAQFFVSFVLYGVTKAAAEVETQAKESILLTRVTQARRVGAPKVSCTLSCYLLFPGLWWGHDRNVLFVLLRGFLA